LALKLWFNTKIHVSKVNKDNKYLEISLFIFWLTFWSLVMTKLFDSTRGKKNQFWDKGIDWSEQQASKYFSANNHCFTKINPRTWVYGFCFKNIKKM